jgi:SAM-dependent MidA family methyltransferase
MNLRDLDASHNAALRRIIVDRIESSGPISFAEFYELALYHPRHGYYFACDPSLDFRSSPNVHPVFGAALGRQLADFWRGLGRPERFDVFEAGAGSFRLAADVLRHVEQVEPQAFAATRYIVQDVTLTNEDASTRLAALELPEGKVEVAAALPQSAAIEGCILSNELLDALPFRRVRVRDGRPYELLVGLQDGELTDVEVDARPEISSHFDALGVLPGEGCEAEVNFVAPAWMSRAARALRRGYLLTLDYGYEVEELYAPWRRRGTLLTFYRHTSGDDPFARIGRQDITASVDFSSVRRAGEQAGLQTLAFTGQSEYLAALGIGEALHKQPAPSELEAFYELRRAVMELTDPAGLGRIKVLIQAKGLP